MDTELQSLVDRYEIEQTIYRYCRGLDRLDADVLRSVYHPDAVDDHGFFSAPRDEFIAWVIETSRQYTEVGVHTVSNVLIELDGDVAYVESHLHSFQVCGEESGGQRLDWMAGRYVDRFERRDGDWRIAHRTLVMDFDHSMPLASAYADPGVFPGGLPVRGSRSRQDPAYQRAALQEARHGD